jgi:hypothetical protein
MRVIGRMGFASALVFGGMLAGGCGFVRQYTSPSLAALRPYGALTVPGDDETIDFTRDKMNDDDLSRAYPHLKTYAPHRLSLRGREISDLSISLLMQLDCVERLDLTDTLVTEAGLRRLGAMNSLRELWVGDQQFETEELARIRAALPTTKVYLTRTQ